MYMIYWTEGADPKSQPFESDKLLEVLKYTEALRKRQRDGEPVSFVTMVSENPNSVGRPGVDVTGPDYDWKKRRP